jgi:hypothetical protein
MSLLILDSELDLIIFIHEIVCKLLRILTECVECTTEIHILILITDKDQHLKEDVVFL